MIKTFRQEMKITEEDSLCFLPLRSNISNPAILFVFITAVRGVWYQGLTCGSGCQSLSKHMSEQFFCFMDCRFGRFVLSASSETQGQLQSSSKVLKHFPSVDLGITSGLSASKYAWLNIGEGEGTLQ